MKIPDDFSGYYQEFLEGSYDCIDRIVLNGYFYLAQSGGGFRCWWRRLTGGDEGLDNTHLMRFSGRFSRRVRAYCQKQGIPLIFCNGKEDKHKLAEEMIPDTPEFQGIFCILVSRAPNVVFEVHEHKSGSIYIRRKDPYPHVNHYSFHIIDPEWGHITIKLCPHPPFNVQIILNGHEYVAIKAKEAQLEFIKESNCFTSVSNAPGLNTIAETMIPDSGDGGRLFQVCERWIYSACLCFALTLDEQKQSRFHYQYSVYQMEYSRNLLFHRGDQLDQIYESVIDRTRGLLNIKCVKTIFGYRCRPRKSRRSGSLPKFEAAVERPVYNLTIFRITFGKLVVKMYSKGERLLRIEAVVQNSSVLRCGKRLEKFAAIAFSLEEILQRFLSVLRSVDACFVSFHTLEEWRLPSAVGATRLSGIDIHQQRIKTVMQALIALSVKPKGFKASELALKVKEMLPTESMPYQVRQASYDLKKFRGKALVNKLGNSHRYKVPPEALREMAACLILQQEVIIPLLENAGKAKLGPKPKYDSQIDQHYRNIQMEMQHVFEHLNIAA
jgi:hypothetical protein